MNFFDPFEKGGSSSISGADGADYTIGIDDKGKVYVEEKEGEKKKTTLLDDKDKNEFDKKISDEIQKVVDSAPEDFNTLREVGDWIEKKQD